MKKAIDRAFMVFWLLLGLAVCAYARTLGFLGPSGPDSGFFPMITGILITASGALLLIRRGELPAQGEPFFEQADAAARVLLVVGALLAMIVLIPHLGFLVTGATVTPLLLRAIDARPWPFCILVGILSATAIVLLFSKALNVPLPVSALGI